MALLPLSFCPLHRSSRQVHLYQGAVTEGSRWSSSRPECFHLQNNLQAELEITVFESTLAKNESFSHSINDKSNEARHSERTLSFFFESAFQISYTSQKRRNIAGVIQ